MTLILASNSSTRQALMRNAGIEFEVIPARVDEAAIKAALLHEGAAPRDLADALAEYKARRVSEKRAADLVLGCDQILSLKSEIVSKADDRTAATQTLQMLQGKTHHLYSAAVIYEGGEPKWRHVGVARMTMHTLTDDEIDAYFDLTWPDVSGSVGCYHAERLGARLFSRIEGDWFSVLGLPLLDVMSYLKLRGWRPS